jgi:predicted DNA-binding protein YlxM (UPF0122 family)
MKKATTKKTDPLPPEVKPELPALREFNTYDDVLKITEEEIGKLSKKERIALLEGSNRLVKTAEKEGSYSLAKDLKSKMYFVIENYIHLEGGVKDYKRQDWEINHSNILSCIHNYVLNNNNFPALNTIAQNTGLSRQTIYEHLKTGIAGEFYQEKLKIWESLTDNIYKNLYYQAINGSVQASKILLDNIYRSSTTPATNIREQNNYIQINNTKIDELTIAELPDVAKDKIIDILKQYAIKRAI